MKLILLFVAVAAGAKTCGNVMDGRNLAFAEAVVEHGVRDDGSPNKGDWAGAWAAEKGDEGDFNSLPYNSESNVESVGDCIASCEHWPACAAWTYNEHAKVCWRLAHDSTTQEVQDEAARLPYRSFLASGICEDTCPQVTCTTLQHCRDNIMEGKNIAFAEAVNQNQGTFQGAFAEYQGPFDWQGAVDKQENCAKKCEARHTCAAWTYHPNANSRSGYGFCYLMGQTHTTAAVLARAASMQAAKNPNNYANSGVCTTGVHSKVLKISHPDTVDENGNAIPVIAHEAQHRCYVDDETSQCVCMCNVAHSSDILKTLAPTFAPTDAPTK